MMEDEGKEKSALPALQDWMGRRRRLQPRRFSKRLSTEELNKIEDGQEPMYVGAFGHIRKQFVDHASYHEHYRKERQWLHDSIIEDFVNSEFSPCSSDGDNQWFVLTVGVQGTGKRFTMESLMEEHGLRLNDFCFIDSDELRQLLPEFDVYMAHEPEVADSLMQKEAGYIAETMCWAALQNGQSVLWDSSLRFPEWFLAHIRKAKRLFPSMRTAAIHVTAPTPDIVMERRNIKSAVTGRHLYGDEEYIQSEMNRIKTNFDVLSPEADVVATICNAPDRLELIDDTWQNFLSPFTEQKSKLHGFANGDSVEDHDPTDSQKAQRRSSARSSTLLSRRSCSNLSQSRRRFSVLQSTEQNHRSDDMNFYGSFAHIRASLDYSYHTNYAFKRQRFQDAILQEFLQGAVIIDKDGVVCTTPQEPWIVFTAGPMGAGKSYTMHHLVEHGRFPLLAFVNVDPDEIRRHFPEFQIYAEQAPELAGELTRKEAGYLAEILTLAGLQAGKNVLLDGSLRDSVWYRQYFKRLRTEFPVLRLAIIQVTAPIGCVMARAKARAKATGRVVPEPLLLEVYEQVPKSVNDLKDLVDYHVTIDNPSDHGALTLLTEGETWESFQANWIQTCAWVPRKLQKQKPKQTIKDGTI